MWTRVVRTVVGRSKSPEGTDIYSSWEQPPPGCISRILSENVSKNTAGPNLKLWPQRQTGSAFVLVLINTNVAEWRGDGERERAAMVDRTRAMSRRATTRWGQSVDDCRAYWLLWLLSVIFVLCRRTCVSMYDWHRKSSSFRSWLIILLIIFLYILVFYDRKPFCFFATRVYAVCAVESVNENLCGCTNTGTKVRANHRGNDRRRLWRCSGRSAATAAVHVAGPCDGVPDFRQLWLEWKVRLFLLINICLKP